jgi:hypothetical protein
LGSQRTTDNIFRPLSLSGRPNSAGTTLLSSESNRLDLSSHNLFSRSDFGSVIPGGKETKIAREVRTAGVTQS